MSKIILDLCGGTGSWSKPYRDAGCDVRLITLPENDVRTYQPPENVYGILAAPPCMEFSIAKANNPRNFYSGMETVEACFKVIWHCRKKSKLSFWALENPVGFLRQFIGKPFFTFRQWEFKDKGVKPTDLWGYFNPPRKTETVRPDGLMRTFPNGSKNAVNWGGSSKKRAITPLGLDRKSVV